jgi:hypothetical protein
LDAKPPFEKNLMFEVELIAMQSIEKNDNDTNIDDVHLHSEL